MGETFPVFPPGHTEVQRRVDQSEYPGVPRFSAHVALDTDGRLCPLPVLLTSIAAWKDQSQAFTPFQPDLGYHVTGEDFNPYSRLAKLEEVAYSRGGRTSDIPGHPLLFSAFVDNEDLAPLGVLEPDPRYTTIQRFTDEAYEVVDQLILLFEADGLRFASRPDWTALQSGDIVFHNEFYPLDSGPLAVPDHMPWTLHEGLHIALPADYDRLVQIKASFRLLNYSST